MTTMRRMLLAGCSSLALATQPTLAGTKTSVQWGVDRTVTPWSLCVYDGTNTCQPVFSLPASGGGAASLAQSIGSAFFFAREYGNCTWDATHDVQPCVAAAITAANAAGGGSVVIPAGTFGVATTLLQPYSNVHLIGNGVGDPRDNSTLDFVPGTRLIWIGAGMSSFTGNSSGTTSLTVSSVTGAPLTVGRYLGASGGAGVPAGTKIVAQVSGAAGGAGVYTTNNVTTLSAATMTAGDVLFDSEPSGQTTIFNADISGTVFDCNNAAAICAVIKSNSFSSIDVGYSEPGIVGVFYSAAAITDAPGSQSGYQLVIRGRQTSTTSTAAGIWVDNDLGATFNVSENLMNISMFAWYGAGDGIVIGNSDNDTFSSIYTFKQPGVASYGTSCVFAETGYLSKNGWKTNGPPRSHIVLHNDCADMQVRGPNPSGFAKDINVLFTDSDNAVPDPVFGTYATGYYGRTGNPYPSPGNPASPIINSGLANNIGAGSFHLALGQSNNVAGLFPTAIGYGSSALNNFTWAAGIGNASNGILSWTRGAYASDWSNLGWDCYTSGDLNTPGDAEACQAVLRNTGTGGSAIRVTTNSVAATTFNCLNIPANTGVGIDVSLEAVDHATSSIRYTAKWSQAHEIYRGSTAASTRIDGGTSNVTADYVRRAGFASGETMSMTPDTSLGCMNLSFTPPNTDAWDVVARVSMVIAQ